MRIIGFNSKFELVERELVGSIKFGQIDLLKDPDEKKVLNTTRVPFGTGINSEGFFITRQFETEEKNPQPSIASVIRSRMKAKP